MWDSLYFIEDGIMNFLSLRNKVFNILEFPKCTRNAIPENTEPIYANELLQECVINCLM